MNSYELSRAWFDYCFENPEKVKPNHTALYFFCIEHCNRLGWKEKFGLPTTMTKEAIGIKSYNTYKNTLDDLVAWKFIKMIETSKNQYSANIIALSNFNKALNNALDKALIKHTSKQSESKEQSIDSIVKQINNKQFNNKQLTILKNHIEKFINGKGFDFKIAMLELGVEKDIIEDWLKVRKTKKATNTKTAFDKIKTQIEKTGYPANDCIKLAVTKDWRGFEASWVENLKQQSTPKKKPNQEGLDDIYKRINDRHAELTEKQ